MNAQLEEASTANEGRNALADAFRRTFAREAGLARWGAWVFSALLLLSLLVCAFHVYAVSRQSPQNSDSVQGFMEAQSILHGNLLLSGWYLSSDNYLFTDTPFFVAYQILFGHRMDALSTVPSIIYVLTLVACLAASIRSFKLSRHNVLAMSHNCAAHRRPSFARAVAGPACAFRAAVPPDFHAATILHSSVSLILLAKLAQASNILDRPLLTLGVGLSCIIAVGSDPFAVIFAFGPALLVSLIDVTLSGGERKYIGLTALILFSLAVGLAVPTLISRLGGFDTSSHDFSVRFIDA